MISFKQFLPVLALFMLINTFGMFFIYLNTKQVFNIPFILVVNTMLFTLSILNYRRISKMNIKKPTQMVQSVMIGTLVKMMVFAVAALIFSKYQKAPVGLVNLFISMGIYLVYTYLEIQWTLKKQ